MDNSLSWATPVPVGAALLGGGVLLIGAAALSGSDPAGVVIMGLAGLLLLLFGASSLLIRPRLAAVDDGLLIRTLTGRHVYGRTEISRIRIVSYPRFGRTVPSLEIDLAGDTEADERLVILGRWELGAHPVDVADELALAGYTISERRDMRPGRR